MKTFFEHFNAKNNNPFFIKRNKTYSFEEIKIRVIKRSKNLKDGGVGKGQFIALQKSSSLDFFVDLFALWKLDAIAVPFSPKDPLKEIKKWNEDIPFSFHIQEEKLLKLSVSVFEQKRPCLVILTSGSSGRPKGVLLDQKNLFYSALGTNQFYSLEKHDRWGLTLPPHHIAGLMIGLRCLIAGASVLIKPETQSLNEFVNIERPTFLSLVPHQLKNILNSDHSLKAILVGGAQVSNALMVEAKRQRLPLSPTYGLSEMASQVTAQRPCDFLEKKNICHLGSPLPYRNLEIDSKGKIHLGGATSFLGYITNKKMTSPYNGHKWATQDLGEITKSGHLIIKGRADNIFISGGENINPFEIETALKEHKDIEEVQVVPVPHSKFGKVPFAFYKSKNKITKEELSSFLKDKIHPFKKPKYYSSEFSHQGIKPKKKELEKIALEIVKKENLF